MYKEDLLDKDLKLEYILLKFLYLSKIGRAHV